MKILIDRAELLKTLSHVQSVVERRNTITILSNILFRAEDERLSLTATDMDIEIIEDVACTIRQPGTLTAPAHTLYDIVRKLPDGAEIELDGTGGKERLTVRAGRSTFTLPALPIADFPTATTISLPHKFTLASALLKTLIDCTRFAISTEETRYYLNGIYLHQTKKAGVSVLRAVATDGHRLAQVEIPLPEGAGDIPGVIIPRKTVQEVRKLLDETDGDISIALSETRIAFQFDRVALSSKLIDGTFPDYERVIPSGNDKTLSVDRKLFAEAVDRVATISTEKSRAVKLALAEDHLTLSATSPDAGSATEELEVVYRGAPLEIGFNARYLLDIAGQIDGGEAELMIADAASPTVIRDPGDDRALYVLMPMRV